MGLNHEIQEESDLIVSQLLIYYFVSLWKELGTAFALTIKKNINA
jgi:hypothetical protein